MVTVVTDLQNQPVTLESKLNLGLGTAGVLAALVTLSLKMRYTSRRRCTKLRLIGGAAKVDVAPAEHVAGKTPHRLRQVPEVFVAWVDGPDDIAHGVDELARGGGDQGQRLVRGAASARFFDCHNRSWG